MFFCDYPIRPRDSPYGESSKVQGENRLNSAGLDEDRGVEGAILRRHTNSMLMEFVTDDDEGIRQECLFKFKPF